MKKFLAALLAAVMVLSMSLTAMADSTVIKNNDQTYDRPYEIKVTLEGDYETVYAIEITWDSLTFNYVKYAENYTWNPDTLAYEKKDSTQVDNQEGWKSDETLERTIKVVNKSNAPVYVRSGIEDPENPEGIVAFVKYETGVTLTLTGAWSLDLLQSAETVPEEGPRSMTYKLSVGENDVPTVDSITGNVRIQITPYDS